MEPTHSILLCEEDAAARAFLADNLIADGYDVITADCKPAALAKLASRQPDAVICDVNGDTLDLLDAVRASRRRRLAHRPRRAADRPHRPRRRARARAPLRPRQRRRDRQAAQLPGAARARAGASAARRAAGGERR